MHWAMRGAAFVLVGRSLIVHVDLMTQISHVLRSMSNQDRYQACGLRLLCGCFLLNTFTPPPLPPPLKCTKRTGLLAHCLWPETRQRRARHLLPTCHLASAPATSLQSDSHCCAVQRQQQQKTMHANRQKHRELRALTNPDYAPHSFSTP